MVVSKENKAIEDYYTFCLSTCGEKRLKKIKAIMENCRRIIDKDLTKLKVGDVVKFLSYINQSDYKLYTKNDYKKLFKRYLKWYYKDLDMIEGSKVKGGFRCVSSLRAFNKEKVNKNTLIKPEELEKLIRGANSMKWKALISLMFESGFRPCEISNLRWKNIKFDDSLGLCRVWTLSPKTKNSREVPVKDCIVHLKRWKAEYQFPNISDSDFVFPAQHHRDRIMGDGVITEMFKRICRKAEIRHINPYMLRHSRIYEIQKKLPEKLASKFAGHSIETSEIYNHIDSDDVEESMLKHIYLTEELTPEQKNKYDKKIAEIEEKMVFQYDNLNKHIFDILHGKIPSMKIYDREGKVLETIEIKTKRIKK